MPGTGIKIAVLFLCLLYSFAFFEVDVPGYDQTYQDDFDTYVLQSQDNHSPGYTLVCPFAYAALSEKFIFHPEREYSMLQTAYSASSGIGNTYKIYLMDMAFLI